MLNLSVCKLRKIAFTWKCPRLIVKAGKLCVKKQKVLQGLARKLVFVLLKDLRLHFNFHLCARAWLKSVRIGFLNF